ncbi:MAG: GGDEF domain-containing protein [Clostridia bacterium]
MEKTVALTKQSKCMTTTHHPSHSTMAFHPDTWNDVPPHRMEERLDAWCRAANEEQFRLPVQKLWIDNELHLHFPALPSGYYPLSQISLLEFSADAKLTILQHVCDALLQLHNLQFHIGFLAEDLLHINLVTLEVKLDFQPFSPFHPFRYSNPPVAPATLLSRAAQYVDIPRVADFYAIGQLAYRLFTGEYAVSAENRCMHLLPGSIQEITACLLDEPERYCHIEELRERFSPGAPSAKRLTFHADHQFIPDLLHPMCSPLPPSTQAQLRQFMDEPVVRLLGLFSEDKALRHDICMEHVMKTDERHFWVVIHCKNSPFATLHEVIERSLHATAEVLPAARPKLKQLSQRFSRIISTHHDGFRIYAALADWVYGFYLDIFPLLTSQTIYYVVEDSEHFDEESQKVFLHFWEKYSHILPGLHIVFSGRRKPKRIPAKSIQTLALESKAKSIYQRLLVSQLGKADDALIEQLSHCFVEHHVDYLHCRLFLLELVEQNRIVRNDQSVWHLAANGLGHSLNLSTIIIQRLERLTSEESRLLRVLAFMPQPVRLRHISEANTLNTQLLPTLLLGLSRVGLLRVYNDNNVYLHPDVAQLVLAQLPRGARHAYAQKAIELMYQASPNSLDSLIGLARITENDRLLYFLLIKHYRQSRSLLSLNEKLSMLEELRSLQKRLQRDKVLCWDRQLFMVNLWLNQFGPAKETSLRLLEQTGDDYDRFSLLRMQLFLNEVDLLQLKRELHHYYQDVEKPLVERARAAHLLFYTDSFIPFSRREAEHIHRFYRDVFYPRRNQVSIRVFAEFTIIYTIMLFQYFPEKEAWASALLEKLESLLQTTTQHIDLLIDLFNCYIFHSNVAISRTYNQRQLETARRYGFANKEQLSCLNGMELSLFQGDVAGYRYHLAQIQRTGKIQRWDLQEQLLMHQLLYTCEWEEWEQFDALRLNQLSATNLTEVSLFMEELYSCYAAYRRRQPIPARKFREQTNESILFLEGICLAADGRRSDAIRLFQKSIATNGYRLLAGWAYREMLELLIALNSDETDLWLSRFEEYILSYGYQLFWPDLYRASAHWAMKRKNDQRAMLFLRRAINGYQLIEKPGMQKELSQQFKQLVQPALPTHKDDPLLNRLLLEREKFLHQALDLSVIIQLSQQVTKSLELGSTIRRLVHALFEYFPIHRLSINYQLFYRNETDTYSASGMIDDDELLHFQLAKRKLACRRYTLYQQEKHRIELEVYTARIGDTELHHMEHFLSFIKPHIANTLLYMEMMIDDLTGFYQRRYFLDRLSQEFELATRYGLDLSLIMLDLDNFRNVNAHGHQEGDKVLKEVAALIRSLLRKNDIPGRYGGEEMLLVLPKTDGRMAVRLAEELRQLLEETFSAGRPYQVTASIGVASLEKCGARCVDDLIRFADEAEITAKTNGKNRVVAAWLT